MYYTFSKRELVISGKKVNREVMAGMRHCIMLKNFCQSAQIKKKKVTSISIFEPHTQCLE